MSKKIILQMSYKKSDLQTYSIQFPSIDSGTSLSNNYLIASLNGNENVNQIIYINYQLEYLTFPTLYNNIYNITIQFKDNSAIFANNSNESMDISINSKQIIPIISCTGTYLGKSGYIVFDNEEEIINITIVLNN